MTDFCLWQLEDDSYLLIDKLANYYSPPLNHSQGSWACRQLLTKFQQTYHQPSPLQEKKFPYFFYFQQIQYFVSFSHSCQHIAVLISTSQKIGVDIEDRLISYKVAERFFHKDEMCWINSLGKNHQNNAIKILWTLKESMIKTQLGHVSLIKGLGVNIFKSFSQAHLEKILFHKLWKIDLLGTTMGFLVGYDCGFILFQQD